MPKQPDPATAYPELDGCPHHWAIESPNGPTCKGVCRICSLEREFPTSSYQGDTETYFRPDGSKRKAGPISLTPRAKLTNVLPFPSQARVN